ncbi:MAG: (2Fe-2S)-binding protein [Advenella sp.]
MVIQEEDSSFYEQLQQALGRLLPVSAAPLCGPADLTLGRVRQDALQLLFDDVARLHPEAGRHYWNAHTWRTCMWVPVYTTILTYEHHRCLVDARQMQIRFAEGLAKQVYLPEQAITRAISDEMAPATALAESLEQIRQQLNTITPLAAKLAGRHTADSVLAALLLYYHDLPQFNNAHIRVRGQIWLSAIGLASESGYLDVDMSGYGLPDRLSLNRRVCCQYFRCPNAPLCSNCPKIPLQERLPLLARDWAEHDRAHAETKDEP